MEATLPPKCYFSSTHSHSNLTCFRPELFTKRTEYYSPDLDFPHNLSPLQWRLPSISSYYCLVCQWSEYSISSDCRIVYCFVCSSESLLSSISVYYCWGFGCCSRCLHCLFNRKGNTQTVDLELLTFSEYVIEIEFEAKLRATSGESYVFLVMNTALTSPRFQFVLNSNLASC